MSFLTSIYSLGNIIDVMDIKDLTIEQYLELTQNHAPSVGIKIDDMTIAEYLEYDETIKTQDYNEYQPHSAKTDVPTKYMDHLSPFHKSPDPPLDAKTNPYLQASQSPIHPKITKTPSIYTRENEEQINRGLGVNKDMDDLEGIIDHLQPTLYEGFIGHNYEAYKRRRNKLPGMPYTEPPLIIKEEAEITRYNLGAGEVFTNTKILNIKEFPRTAPDIADVRAEIINNKNGSSEDLSNTKRRHWCKPIYQKEDICTKWASCNPYFHECDGGDNPRENKEYWESSNDDIRTTLEWENLSFDNWVRVAFGKGIKSLQEDRNKDFCQNSNFKAMLREFLVLILLFPFYFISLMYNKDIVQIKWEDGSRINTWQKTTRILVGGGCGEDDDGDGDVMMMMMTVVGMVGLS
ncbi:hypothetical protein Tco_0863159 [Tanacetum coccineum]